MKAKSSLSGIWWISFLAVALLGINHWQADASVVPYGEAAAIVEALEKENIGITDVEIRITVPLPSVAGAKDLLEQNQAWAHELQIPAATQLVQEHSLIIYENSIGLPSHKRHYRLVGKPGAAGYDAFLVVWFQGGRDQYPLLVNAGASVMELLKSRQLIPQISTCIRGIYNDTLSVDQQGDAIESIFDSLQASELERLDDETVVSVSGYTRLWDAAIDTNEQKMNLQVAAHRDHERQLTRFTVGTPIITAEY